MKHSSAPSSWGAIALACSLFALLVAPAHVTAADAKASRYYEDALTRYEKQDLPGAIIQLKNALQIDKAMLPVQVLLGKALLENGDFIAAEVALMEALRLGVNRAEVVLPLTRAYLAQGKHKLVLEQTQFAVSGLPPSTQASLLVLRASAMSDMGDSRGALLTIDEARRLDPASPDTWLAEVPIRIRGRQFSEAHAAIGKAMALAPGSAEARYQQGSVYHVQGNAKAALAAYDQALATDATHVETRVARAGLYLDASRDADAAADLKQLQSHVSNEPRAAYLRAQIARRAGKHAESRVLLKEVTALLDPVPLDAIRYRTQLLLLNGLAHHGLGEMEKARTYLDALQRSSGITPASKLLAQILFQLQESATAVEVLQAYLKVFPQDGQAMVLLASALMAQGRNAPAISLMQEALRHQDSPDLRATLGMGLLGSGDPSRGAAELEAALRKDPSHLQAGMALASLHLRSGQGAKAVPVVQVMVRRQPNNPVLQNMLGMALAQTGQAAEAKAAFERAAAQDEDLVAPRLHLARLEIAARQYDAAGKRLEDLLKRNEKNIDVLMELSLLANRRGQPDQTMLWLQKAYDHAGGRDLRPGLALVDLHLAAGRNEPAFEIARNLAASAPARDVSVLVALGRVQLARGDAVGARGSLSQASRAADLNAKVQVGVATLQMAADHVEGAAYSLDKALQAEPDFLPALAMMVDVDLRQRNTVQAEQRARQIAERHPKRAIGFSLLGDVAAAKSQPAAALESYRRAHQTEPSSATFARLMAVLWGQDEGRGAVQLAEQWSRRNPADAAARRVLADAYARSGNYPMARTAYEALLKTTPNDAGAMNNLANVLLQTKDAAGAVAVAERAVVLTPADANAIDTLAWALFHQGNRDRALQLLRDARLREPSSSSIRYHLASVLAQAGRRAEARTEAEAALTVPTSPDRRRQIEDLLATLR